MKFKQMRVNDGNSHDSLNVASSECRSDGKFTGLDEIIDTLKKLKDVVPADFHHQGIVKQDIVTVTIENEPPAG